MDPQQQQEMSNTLENMLGCSRSEGKKGKAEAEEAQKCPRCESTNTKFCYYNNYSLSQPRYFCKSCRRYWTKGGTLRNVPVGGGCRKNKRSSSSKPTSLLNSYDSNDLTIAFATLQQQQQQFSNNISEASFVDAVRCGYQNSTNFQSLYYGNGSGGEMMSDATTTAVTVTTTKQEMLWGLPWQINGGDEPDLDSGRQTWNGFAPSWHLNSPLM